MQSGPVVIVGIKVFANVRMHDAPLVLHDVVQIILPILDQRFGEFWVFEGLWGSNIVFGFLDFLFRTTLDLSLSDILSWLIKILKLKIWTFFEEALRHLWMDSLVHQVWVLRRSEI